MTDLPPLPAGDGSPPRDGLDRPLRDLRLSLTDRCNFRCTYCMPREVFGPGFPFLPRDQILTFEEIVRVTRLFAALGVRKVRLTGGEPLLRHDLPLLIRMLRELGGLELTLTTNGALLSELAQPLADAGLDRLTVSLDALDDAVFREVNGVDFPVAQVLAGIAAAEAAGFRPIKINAVIRRGLNESAIVDLPRHFRGSGHVVRFIEYMDVGTSNGWRLDEVVPGAEVLARLAAELPLEPLDRAYRGEVASRYRFRDGGGEIGLITSVTQPFCGDCTRARISAEGRLYTCLFAAAGIDLRAPLRGGVDDTALLALLHRTWRGRGDRYSELRSAATGGPPRVEMSYIGG